MRLRDFAHAHIDVEALGEQIHPAVHQLQPDVQIRMLSVQFGQDWGEVVAAQSKAGTDAQCARDAGMGTGHTVVEPISSFQHFLSPGIGGFTCIADFHAAGGAVKQRDAQSLLQVRHALAHIGRGDAKLGGCGHEAGSASHLAEHAKISKIPLIVHDS